MTLQEAIFEAPIAHESHAYSQETYESPETAFAWEHHEAAHTGEAAFESSYEDELQEWAPESAFETFESQEWQESPEAWESQESAYEADPFLGSVLGAIGSAIGLESEDEWTGESDQFFSLKKALRAVKSVARRALPFATKAFASMIPGGALLAPMASKLAGQLLKEGEAEASALEAQLFSPESIGESGAGEAAYEAALTEVLAAEAASTETDSEAASVLSATLPITITIMGGRRALRPVVPALAQANGRLVRVLRRQGPVGTQLLRTVPAIQRRAIGTLRAAARSGRPITGPLAIRAMSTATRQVLGNPRTLARTLSRNEQVNQTLGPRLGGGPRAGGYRSMAYRPLATRGRRLGY